MPALPSNPAPSSINFKVEQPTSMSMAIDGVSRQARSTGTFIISIDYSYTLLEYSERDILEAFLVDMSGRFVEFDVIVPTRSENSSVTSASATPSANYAANTSVISLTGVVGELKANNLLRVNGKKATYIVVEAFPNSSGTQQVRIKPPLREALATTDSVITKNVPINVYLDKDTVKVKSKGMSASVSFTLVESPK